MLWSKFSAKKIRSVRRLAICCVQCLIFTASGITAFLLRFEFSLPHQAVLDLIFALPIWVCTKAVVFHALSLDRGGWRYVSVPDIVRLAIGNMLGSLGALVLILFIAPAGFPRSLYVLDLLICGLATAAVRLVIRMSRYSSARLSPETKRVVIYGAGQAGVTLLSEIRDNPRLGYTVCGFVDDDLEKLRQVVQGVRVLGTGADLTAMAAKYALDEVLVAMQSAPGSRISSVLRSCHDAGLRCRTIPSLSELIEHRELTPQIRDVAVEDLLGRSPVLLNEHAIRETLGDQVVLVTGAAGSIGSELCRQIARFSPRKLVAYDMAETPLFELDRELRVTFPNLAFSPEIGSIQNRSRLDEVFRRHRPSSIFHAAAYKHVPMMEANLFEAVENNILGTENLVLAAAQHDVRDFTMISSDKAVCPTNVMGATKRVAELLVNASPNGSTRYSSVRFGNVLGSNGSVVPIFKKQIAAGGPITITHPEMRRYFMTIPEAAALVLQSSTMGEGGEIFVLDMGKQIRIVDLATNLILLSGLEPHKDIELRFTGVRPGEKLYEELSCSSETTLPTFHEKILVYSGPVLAASEMQKRLSTIRRCCAERDSRRLLLELKQIVPDYNPSGQILTRLLVPELDLEELSEAPVLTEKVAA